ncbi:MAG: hypothetical protein LBC18_00040 [Opitutaceae bacterium]|nr:hypothetical protein [Opitutaceae bacterium]
MTPKGSFQTGEFLSTTAFLSIFPSSASKFPKKKTGAVNSVQIRFRMPVFFNEWMGWKMGAFVGGRLCFVIFYNCYRLIDGCAPWMFSKLQFSATQSTSAL